MFKKFFIGCSIFALVLLLGSLIGGFWAWRTGNLARFVAGRVAAQLTNKPEERSELQKALGFDRTKTYLVLLLNNNELRPGGGFIGSYAVVTVTNGRPEILKVEGTEIIDFKVPKVLLPLPKPMATYLHIDTWQFRDSNWSPDFPTSASTSLNLYVAERGFKAKEIDGVVAFTPTVFEKLLKIIGPITVSSTEFTAENLTEKLEFEVEYGFAGRGLPYNQRKSLLIQLAHAVADRVIKDGLAHWGEYVALAPELLEHKQVVLWSPHPEVQKILAARGWDGRFKQVGGDFLMWADANLGAWKTDASMERSLTYRISPTSSGYIGEVTMRYNHLGKFDKFTTYYRDYARVFVPAGSKLLSVKGGLGQERGPEVNRADQGVELGRQWFGAFTSIAPGKTRDLTFRFSLSPEVTRLIDQGKYQLTAQKQIGTLAVPLTLQLNFGKTIQDARPANRAVSPLYQVQTTLLTDAVFQVRLTP